MKKLLQKYKETGFYKAFDKPWVQRLLNRKADDGEVKGGAQA